MANSYVYPGSSDTYVPSLSADLVIEFSRNPDKFPLVQYIDYRQVDKQVGYYVRMLNDNQVRIIDDTDNIWADGADTPLWTDGTDSFTFPQFRCVRRRQPKRLGHLAIDQAGWDIVDQASRLEAMQLMTKRVKRIHSTLTTSANWSYGLSGGSSNYATATTAGGGVWSAATGALPYIRKSLAYAQIAIEQATYGVVSAGDLFLVLNPNVAKTVATSQEFLDFVKQNPTSIAIWENQPQFGLYGIPENLMGLRVIVDNTVYNSAAPGVAASLAFTLSDSYAVLVSKQRAITAAAGSSFSTVAPFLYEDMVVEVFDDPENRRVNLFITENIDDSSNCIVAPQSGFLIKIDS
jgi:hypothetical protein